MAKRDTVAFSATFFRERFAKRSLAGDDYVSVDWSIDSIRAVPSSSSVILMSAY